MQAKIVIKHLNSYANPQICFFTTRVQFTFFRIIFPFPCCRRRIAPLHVTPLRGPVVTQPPNVNRLQRERFAASGTRAQLYHAHESSPFQTDAESPSAVRTSQRHGGAIAAPPGRQVHPRTARLDDGPSTRPSRHPQPSALIPCACIWCHSQMRLQATSSNRSPPLPPPDYTPLSAAL